MQWMSRYVCRCRTQDAGRRVQGSREPGQRVSKQNPVKVVQAREAIEFGGGRRGTTFRSQYYVDEPTTSLKPLQMTGLETKTLDGVTVHRKQA